MSRANPDTPHGVVEYILSRVEFDTNGGCWLWPGAPNASGYGGYSLHGKTQLAHRVSYAAFKGPIPKGTGDRFGLVVMHKCDTPACVNPEHLLVGTQRENIDDRHKKGRSRSDGSRQGVSHHMAKLNESTVLEVRRRVAMGDQQCVVAMEFGLSPVHVSMIVRRRIWRHI